MPFSGGGVALRQQAVQDGFASRHRSGYRVRPLQVKKTPAQRRGKLNWRMHRVRKLAR